MSETVELKEFFCPITNCLMSTATYSGSYMYTQGNWESSFYHIGNNAEINVSRDGGTYTYYAAALEFSTEGLNLSSVKKITLKMTQTSWRNKVFSAKNTSAILCSRGELSNGMINPRTIHNLANKDESGFNSLGAPFIAYVEKGTDLSNWKEQWEISLGEGINIEPNSKYYIYLKRGINYANGDSGNSGFLPLYHPLNGTTGLNSYELKLEGDPFDDSNNPENYILQPTELREYQILQNGNKYEFEILANNPEDQIPEVQWALQTEGNGNISSQMTIEGGSLTYIPNKTFHGKIKVIASWNNGRSQLSSVITVPKKWEGFKSWVAGYAMKIMGTNLPIIAPTHFNYNGRVVRALPGYSEFANPCAYLTIDTVHKDSYFLYISSKPLQYNLNTDIFFVDQDLKDQGIEIVGSVVHGDKNWSDFERISKLENFAISPIWVSERAAPQETAIKYYEPIPVYHYQRGESNE